MIPRSRTLAILAVFLLAGCFQRPIPAGGRNFQEPAFDKRAYGVAYPDLRLTPGDIIPGITAPDVCASGYAGKVRRRLTPADKGRIYASYGLELGAAGYQIDHLIPLSLGGSNEAGNLWPIPVSENSGYREKSQAAAHLHRRVCAGEIGLKAAQAAMKKDWHAVWREMAARKKRGTRR